MMEKRIYGERKRFRKDIEEASVDELGNRGCFFRDFVIVFGGCVKCHRVNFLVLNSVVFFSFGGNVIQSINICKSRIEKFCAFFEIFFPTAEIEVDF